MTNEFKPDYVSPPGETIAEIMWVNRIPVEEVMDTCNIDLVTFCKLIVGLHPINMKIAKGLEQVTGSPHTFWLTRQRHFQESQGK